MSQTKADTKILVKMNDNGSGVVHLPSEDDPEKPKCGQGGTKPWKRKAKSKYPNSRVCDKCKNGYSGGW